MIVAFLVVIVFTLLFGAAAVKGWLKSVSTLIFGFVILIGLVLWLGSFFGTDGPIYIVGGGGLLLFGLAMWLKATEHISEPSSALAKPSPSAKTRLVTLAKIVWKRFEPEIQHRFHIDDQVKAHEIYKTGDAVALEAFCIETIAMINQNPPQDGPFG